MPLEIRELVIKTSIHEGGTAQTSGSSGENNGAEDQAALIAACVEQVLAILKEKAER
jgi:Family of unknown function (DUF5908)